VIPSNVQDLDQLAIRMPLFTQLRSAQHPGTELLQKLNQHLESVQTIYGRIVYAQRPLSYDALEFGHVHEPSHAISAQPARSPAAAFSETTLLKRIDEQAPMFADSIRRSGAGRNIAPLELFWNLLSEHSEYCELVNCHPVLAAYILEILDLSPYLAEQLNRDISLINEIQDVADHPNRRAAFEGLASPLNNITALRRFFRREIFRILTASICASEPVFQTLDRTSALAEFMIARAYRIALERSLDYLRRETAEDQAPAGPENEMMVIALGRLGMREFDLGSDADLLFIIPDSEIERQKFWTRVAEQIIEILTAYTGDSLTLSIDTRLRPNGREGLLVQTRSSYTDYFAHHSEAWEGIAYMKARAVAGDTERATLFLTELQEIDWRRWGQSGRSKQDLKQMRLRLEREQGSANPLKAGPGGYYDADFALMYLRLKGAGLFFKSLNTPERIDIVEKMGHLERLDAEFLLRATTFYRAVDHALRIVTGHAEGKLPDDPADLDVLTQLVGRWTLRPGRPVKDELNAMRESMRQIFDRLFT
jgi:glutamate-ammonia-ligase adenylyltransferase